MPFLPPNQQCQSTEGTRTTLILDNLTRKKNTTKPKQDTSVGESWWQFRVDAESI